MKIKLNVSEFKAALSAINSVVVKSGDSIYKYFLLEVDSSELRITGSNPAFEMIRTITDFSTDEDGSAVIEFLKIYNIVKSLPDDKSLTIKLSDGKLLLTCGKSRSTISVNPDPYPVVKKPSGIQWIDVTGDFITGISKVSHAASVEEAKRKMLNGVAILGDGKKIDIVAADGSRLALYSFESPLNGSAIIPIKNVPHAKNAMQEDGAQIAIIDGKLLVKGSNYLATSRLIDMKYVAYDRAIPKDETIKNKLVFNKEAALDSLKRILVVAPDGTLGHAELYAKSGDCEALFDGITRNTSNKVSEILQLTNTGDDVKCLFNPTFMAQTIGTIDSDTITCTVHSTFGDTMKFEDGKLILVLNQIRL